ncbi:MAG: MFS transporter [Pseudomonadota bacterium]
MANATVREGLKLLHRPDFARLFFAYLITYTGSAMAPIAMAFGVLELTGSARDSSFVIAAPIVAQIVILLIGGAIAGRTSRQKVMVRAELLAATTQFAIAALFLYGVATVPLLAALMMLNGMAIAFFAPSTVGFITQVVDRRDLQAANALLGAARSSATMAGAALAGILVAAFGAGTAIAIDATSFVVSALLLLGIRAKDQHRSEPVSLIEDLKIGWREFTARQWLWAIVLQFGVMMAAIEAVYGLLGPAIARNQMGGAVDWGFIAAASGLGTVAGGLVALRLHVERPMLVASCMCFFFAGTALALSGPAAVALVAAAAFIGGVAGQIFAVLWYTTLQTEIPASMLSRVSAYDHLGSIALAPLGLVVGGVLYEAIGYRPTMLLAAAAIIVPTALVLLVPGVRQLRGRAHP